MDKKSFEVSYNDLLEEFDKWEEPDSEISEQADEMTAEFTRLLGNMFTDEESEYNPTGVLAEDDYLTEEMVDKVAFLNLLETQVQNASEDSGVTDEDMEKAYLSVIDSFFELSKTINPMAGFGRDRLEAGLSLVRIYEDRFGPLATQIVPENAEAFEEFISEEHYADVLAGRKSGIGALRLVEGEKCAAGAAVYSVTGDGESEALSINLDWIAVHPDLRQRGIGNFLMAKLLELALQNEDCSITVELPVVVADESDVDPDGEERAILENFLDSWKFEFTINDFSGFVFKIPDSEDNRAPGSGSREVVVSLYELGGNGQALLEEFLGDFGEEYKGIKKLPIEYFDADVSCAVLKGRKIAAAFLVKRYSSGNYRYEALCCPKDKAFDYIPGLFSFAWRACIENGDAGSMLYGMIKSEEMFDTVRKLDSLARRAGAAVEDDKLYNMEGLKLAEKFISVGRGLYSFRGALYAPDPEDIITTEEWDKIRSNAGLQNDKIPEDGIDDPAMVEEAMVNGF